MTLWRSSSGGKPQRGEDRISGSRVGLPLDPLLHDGEALRSLMNVIALGDVDESFEQLFETFFTRAERRGGGCFGAASGRPRSYDRSYFLVPSHSSAFPQDCPAQVQSRPVAG
jgi:hypothetical protein